jgi:serpin B
MPDLNEWIRRKFLRRAGPRSTPPATEVRARPTGSDAFAEDNNSFALPLFEQLRHSPGNLFFSPFSIHTALAMAHFGAKGETAAQMSEVLRISLSGDEPHGALSDIIGRLNRADRGEYGILEANSLWARPGDPLLRAFLDLIARHYGGTVRQVGFRDDPEGARRTINQWVETQVRGKIRELIPPGGLDAETSLALVNTIYFKGMWVVPFERAETEEEPFYLGGRGKVRVPLMRQEAGVSYQEAWGFQAVDLTYSGGDLSMLVLLPRRKNGLPNLERRLSAGMLRECVARMRAQPVRLFLPRFKYAWGTVDVSAQLANLGMPLAFTPRAADFSGINGKEPQSEESLFLSAVFHRAHLEVTEEGTEAAAATAGTMLSLASPGPSRPPRVPVFRADHPFLFAIRDRNNGSILFLGRVSDPTREGS